MDGLDRDNLATILLNAPGWARVGLTMPDERMRERAADCLAATIVEKLDPMRDQLTLPLSAPELGHVTVIV